MADACFLAHPLPAALLALRTDASNIGIRAVLEQLQGGRWRTLGFSSCTLTAAERRYSMFDQELLAAYSGVHHFRSSI